MVPGPVKHNLGPIFSLIFKKQADENQFLLRPWSTLSCSWLAIMAEIEHFNTFVVGCFLCHVIHHYWRVLEGSSNAVCLCRRLILLGVSSFRLKW